MMAMKLTGYLNLTADDLAYDSAGYSVSLAGSARRYDKILHPSAESATSALREGEKVYEVSCEIADGSLFDVIGAIDQTEGREGCYLAGVFDNYGAAYAAAEGLGVQGTRGAVFIRPAAEIVHSTYADWKLTFNRAESRKIPSAPVRERRDPLTMVQIAPKDPWALGTADPEYAMWLRLNDKFGSTPATP